MWYWRKLGWFVGIALGVGAAISFWYRSWIEVQASSRVGRVLLQLSFPSLLALLFLWVNIRLIYWCGAAELKQRLDAQWKERIVARVENRPYQPKFVDILDYVALSEIWWAKMTYRLHLWDWPDEH